jgi:Protein of unknown function (DUF732)
MKRLTILAVPVAFALLSTGLARADGNDDDFTQRMNNNGVIGAPADLINNAHAACSLLDSGDTPDAVRDALVSQLKLTPNRAAIFVALSATHYCPKYDNLQFKTGS